MLTGVLTYHVVAGRWDAASLARMVASGGGMASIKTVSGGTLTARAPGGHVTLTDEQGGTAKVTIADVMQSNGVIHVVDKVLLPGPAKAAAAAPTNGGTGVSGAMHSGLTREAVRAQTIGAMRNGQMSRGEMSM
jgi:hypothetical protein